MRYPGMLLVSATLLACSPTPQEETIPRTDGTTDLSGTASFQVRNAEIREDMIRMLDEANIEYTVEGDEILYNLADGEAIDRIGNEAISEYITRN